MRVLLLYPLQSFLPTAFHLESLVLKLLVGLRPDCINYYPLNFRPTVYSSLKVPRLVDLYLFVVLTLIETRIAIKK